MATKTRSIAPHKTVGKKCRIHSPAWIEKYCDAVITEYDADTGYLYFESDRDKRIGLFHANGWTATLIDGVIHFRAS